MSKREEILTSDLSKFGYRELNLLMNTLIVLATYGLPEDFYDNDVKPVLNTRSGFVFLTNSEFQVAMLHNGKLESFYTLEYSGKEGFINDLYDYFIADKIWIDDYKELMYILKTNDMIKEANEVREKLKELED